MEGVVHFTIGDGFGQILTNLAIEKITEEHDVLKAIKTLEESLMGIPHELTLDVIAGRRVLEVDEDTQEVIVADYDESKHSSYRVIDWNKWCRDHYHRMIDIFKGFKISLGRARIDLDIINRNGYSIDLTIESVLKYVFSTDKESENLFIEDILDDLKYNDKLGDIQNTIVMAKQITLKAVKLAQCIDHLGKINLFTDEVRHKMYVDNLIARASNVNRDLNDIAHGEFVLPEGDDLKAYIESAVEIGKELEKGIKPIDDIRTYKLCDAYWIAPDGSAYGLCGQIANMLHYQMAHAIINETDVDESINDQSTEGTAADRQLGEQGWCKITNNWVLYDGYYYNKPLTKEQQRIISALGQRINLEKKRPLKVGLTQIEMTGAMFGMVEPLMMKKHLSI